MPSRRPERVLAQLRRHLSPHPTPAASDDAAAATSTAAGGKPRLLYFKGTGKCYGVRLALFAAFGKDGWIDERISQRISSWYVASVSQGEPGSHPEVVRAGALPHRPGQSTLLGASCRCLTPRGASCLVLLRCSAAGAS